MLNQEKRERASAEKVAKLCFQEWAEVYRKHSVVTSHKGPQFCNVLENSVPSHGGTAEGGVSGQ